MKIFFKVLLFTLFTFLGSLAIAAFPLGTQYRTADWSNGVWSSSTGSACAQAIAYLSSVAPVGTTYAITECTTQKLWISRSNSGGTTPYYSQSPMVSRAAPTCPGHSTYSATTLLCSCDVGYEEDATHTSCQYIPPPVDVCDPLKGLPTPQASYETFVSGMGAAEAKNALGKTRLGCATGCRFSANTVASATGSKGTTFVMSDGKFSGFSCDPGAPDTGLGPLETRCSSQDLCPGTVNGVDVCVKCGETGTSDTTSQTPKPAASAPYAGASAPAGGASSPGSGGGSGAGSGVGAGSGSTIGTSPKVNGSPGTGSDVPGGTSTRSQTTCNGSTCTTTKESSTNLGDGKYQNSTSEQVVPKADFCRDNPLNKSCTDGGGSFSGTCGEAPVCKGDAIDCAIASAAHKSACAVERGPMPDAEKIVNIDIPLPAITRNDGWGPETGSCPAAKSINLSFATIPMPFDLLCDFANGIRPFVVGLAWITAAFSFFGFARRGE